MQALLLLINSLFFYDYTNREMFLIFFKKSRYIKCNLLQSTKRAYFASGYLRHHLLAWRPEKVLLAAAFIAHIEVSFTANALRPSVLILCEKESLGWVMEPNVDTIGAQYSATDYTPTYQRPIFVTVWR